MPIVKDEQKIKQQGLFLTIEDGSKVVLLSHLYTVVTQFLEAHKTSVIYVKDGAFSEVQPKTEYLYYGRVNGEEGIFRLAGGVFFDMNNNEKKLDKDKRNFEWIVGKEGVGKQTRWSAVRGNDVTPPTEKEIEEYTKKLVTTMERYEKTLTEKYNELSGSNLPTNVGDEKVEEEGNDLPF